MCDAKQKERIFLLSHGAPTSIWQRFMAANKKMKKNKNRKENVVRSKIKMESKYKIH